MYYYLYTLSPGIVPLVCEDLFKSIAEKGDKGGKAAYEVQLTMLEIYNEVGALVLTHLKADL